MKPLLIIVLCTASLEAHAQAAGDRERLAAERQAVIQRFDQDAQACLLRFAATGCLADARARRRDALAPLRERELSLADEDRQQRALERRRVVASKQQAAAERAPEMPAPVLKLRQPAPPSRSASASAAVAPRMVDDAARAADAAQRAQASARRQVAIDADRQRVADRVAARASEGKPVQPLPPLPPLPPALRASQAPR